MLDRLAGNAALKADLRAALACGRLPHALLFVGEEGCGAGFAARCLAADWMYPGGGPHAEAVLAGRDSECIALRGEGAARQIRVERIREARAAIGRSALSTDAAGRALFLYGAQDLNASSANALLKILEEPPDGVLFLLTARSAAAVLPTVRSRCAAYSLAPVPMEECSALLRRAQPDLPADKAAWLAELYGGAPGAALRILRDPEARAALQAARALCGAVMQQDRYRVQAALAAQEKDREGARALLRQLERLCAAALRDPGFAGLGAAHAEAGLRAVADANEALQANGNLRAVLAALGIGLLTPAIR